GGINLYGFCGNNGGLNYRDPFGLYDPDDPRHTLRPEPNATMAQTTPALERFSASLEAGAKDAGTRALGGLQAVGGGLQVAVGAALVVTPDPSGVTKVVGAANLLYGADSAKAGVQTLVTGTPTPTYTNQGAQAAAGALGASPQTQKVV